MDGGEEKTAVAVLEEVAHEVGQWLRVLLHGRHKTGHIGSKEAGPRIAAIFSIVESCRKLGVPIRQYLADVLPGMAHRSIQSLAELTPAAYAAKLAK